MVNSNKEHHRRRIAENKNMSDFEDAQEGNKPVIRNGKVLEVIDCREVAPSAAYTEMFLNGPNNISTISGLAVGMIGELLGLELAHARHGKLDWATVVEPAMKLT